MRGISRHRFKARFFYGFGKGAFQPAVLIVFNPYGDVNVFDFVHKKRLHGLRIFIRKRKPFILHGIYDRKHSRTFIVFAGFFGSAAQSVDGFKTCRIVCGKCDQSVYAVFGVFHFLFIVRTDFFAVDEREGVDGAVAGSPHFAYL